MNDLKNGTSNKAFPVRAGFTSAASLSTPLVRCEASRDMWEKRVVALERQNALLKNAIRALFLPCSANKTLTDADYEALRTSLSTN